MTQTTNGLLVNRHVSEARDYELLDELEALAGSSWWEQFMRGPTIDSRRSNFGSSRVTLRDKVNAPENPAVQP